MCNASPYYYGLTIIPQTQVSGYPSNGQAANVSKETTSREIIDIEGIDKETFRLQNINLLSGPINSVSYCTEMLNFPTLLNLEHLADDYIA